MAEEVEVVTSTDEQPTRSVHLPNGIELRVVHGDVKGNPGEDSTDVSFRRGRVNVTLTADGA